MKSWDTKHTKVKERQLDLTVLASHYFLLDNIIYDKVYVHFKIMKISSIDYIQTYFKHFF